VKIQQNKCTEIRILNKLIPYYLTGASENITDCLE